MRVSQRIREEETAYLLKGWESYLRVDPKNLMVHGTLGYVNRSDVLLLLSEGASRPLDRIRKVYKN